MPIYSFRCEKCQIVFEKLCKMGTTETICQYCGELTTKRTLTTPNFQFKGKGFYETDYKKKETKGE